MYKYFIIAVSAIGFLYSPAVFAQTLTANDAPYEVNDWQTWTSDYSFTGVLIFDDQGGPFKGLYQPVGVDTYDFTPDYFDILSMGQCGTYTLLGQSDNTCWNGYNDTLETCLGRGQTLASTTFEVTGCTPTPSSTPSSTAQTYGDYVDLYLLFGMSFLTVIASIFLTIKGWNYIT